MIAWRETGIYSPKDGVSVLFRFRWVSSSDLSAQVIALAEVLA